MNSKEFIDVINQGKDSPYYDWFMIDGDFLILKRLIMNALLRATICPNGTPRMQKLENI